METTSEQNFSLIPYSNNKLNEMANSPTTISAQDCQNTPTKIGFAFRLLPKMTYCDLAELVIANFWLDARIGHYVVVSLGKTL